MWYWKQRYWNFSYSRFVRSVSLNQFITSGRLNGHLSTFVEDGLHVKQNSRLDGLEVGNWWWFSGYFIFLDEIEAHRYTIAQNLHSQNSNIVVDSKSPSLQMWFERNERCQSLFWLNCECALLIVKTNHICAQSLTQYRFLCRLWLFLQNLFC